MPITEKPHLRVRKPSPWVERFAALAPPGSPVLDLAAGNGRHGRLFLERGHPVTVTDRDVAPLADLADACEVVQADLEDGSTWPFAERRFGAVVVANYLHRPLFPHILDALDEDGLLIYETFARGHEKLRRPRNPAHLLEEGELLDIVRGRLSVIAYEHGPVERSPTPGIIQRICATVRTAA